MNATTRSEAGWILTYTGRRFWPLDPKPEEVHIEDIAHSLSNQCRYTGHCREFYSVAQHSVLASRICSDAKWGLAHDFTEAYIQDLARPTKNQIPEYSEIEDRLMAVIAERFGLELPMPECVKRADLTLFVTEFRDLMPDTRHRWQPAKGYLPLPNKIVPWSPKMAEYELLDRFNYLFGRTEP